MGTNADILKGRGTGVPVSGWILELTTVCPLYQLVVLKGLYQIQLGRGIEEQRDRNKDLHCLDRSNLSFSALLTHTPFFPFSLIKPS